MGNRENRENRLDGIDTITDNNNMWNYDDMYGFKSIVPYLGDLGKTENDRSDALKLDKTYNYKDRKMYVDDGFKISKTLDLTSNIDSHYDYKNTFYLIKHGEICIPYNYVIKSGFVRTDEITLLEKVDFSTLEGAKYHLEQSDYKHIYKKRILHIFRFAIIFGYIETVKYIRKYILDINAGDGIALLFACEHGHLEIVKFLIENGAKFSKENFKRKYYFIFKHSNILEYLIDNSYIDIFNEKTIKNIVHCSNNENLVKVLFEKGLDFDKYKNHILSHSISYLNIKIAKYMIMERRVYDKRMYDQTLTEFCDDKEFKEYLIEKGAVFDNWFSHHYIEDCMEHKIYTRKCLILIDNMDINTLDVKYILLKSIKNKYNDIIELILSKIEKEMKKPLPIDIFNIYTVLNKKRNVEEK